MQPRVNTQARAKRTRTATPNTGIPTIPEADEEAEAESLPDRNMSGGLPRPSRESNEPASPAGVQPPLSVDGDAELQRSGSYPGDSGTNVPIVRRSTLPSGPSISGSFPQFLRTQDGRAFLPVRVLSEPRMRKGKKLASRRKRGGMSRLEVRAPAKDDADDRSVSSGSDYSRDLTQDGEISRAASRTANEYPAMYQGLVVEESSPQPDTKLKSSHDDVDAMSRTGESTTSNSIQSESGFTVAEVWKDEERLRDSAPEVPFARPSTGSREVDRAAETSADERDGHQQLASSVPRSGDGAQERPEGVEK